MTSSGVVDDYCEISPSGYRGYVGPLFWRGEPEPGLYVKVDLQHLNGGARAHGGFLMSLAEAACQETLKHVLTEARSFSVVSMNCDFMASVEAGQEVFALAEITRQSRSIAFLSAQLISGDRVLMKASSVYALKES